MSRRLAPNTEVRGIRLLPGGGVRVTAAPAGPAGHSASLPTTRSSRWEVVNGPAWRYAACFPASRSPSTAQALPRVSAHRRPARRAAAPRGGCARNGLGRRYRRIAQRLVGGPGAPERRQPSATPRRATAVTVLHRSPVLLFYWGARRRGRRDTGSTTCSTCVHRVATSTATAACALPTRIPWRVPAVGHGPGSRRYGSIHLVDSRRSGRTCGGHSTRLGDRRRRGLSRPPARPDARRRQSLEPAVSHDGLVVHPASGARRCRRHDRPRVHHLRAGRGPHRRSGVCVRAVVHWVGWTRSASTRTRSAELACVAVR